MPLFNSDNTIKHLNLFGKGIGKDIQMLIKAIEKKQNAVDISTFNNSLIFDFVYKQTQPFDVQLWNKFTDTLIDTVDFRQMFFQFSFTEGDNIRLQLNVVFDTLNFNQGNFWSLDYLLLNANNNFRYRSGYSSNALFTDFKIIIQ